MNKSISTKNYQGKKVFIGIDVHKRTYHLTAVCQDVIVKSWSMKADVAQCVESLCSFFQGAEIETVYEAGFSGYNLHRSLCRAGIKNIVINPASVQRSANERVKTDAIDSRKMATQLSKASLKGISVPDEARELRREISRLREQLVENRTCVILQIKSKLHFFGLMAADDNRKFSKRYLDSLQKLEVPPELRYSLDTLIEQWHFLTKKILEINKNLEEQEKEESRTSEIYKSVPGIGTISARVLANELGDLSTRFDNERQLFSYTGLTPSEYTSGDNVRRGHITRSGPPRIRWILTEAAWVCIRYDKSMQAVYERIKTKRGAKRAIVAVARRLIGRIRSCFVNNVTYNVPA